MIRKEMRENFEKWAENQGFNTKTDGESYYFSDTHHVYMAWRACAELVQSRLESLEKDAARYRWLRDKDSETGVSVLDVGQWVMPASCIATTYHSAEALDAAIDTAMQANKGE